LGKEEVFDYYYGTEAEQFSFFRIPRVLIQDPRFKQVSTDAKLLYGLMLDRMSLSMKNGWLDEEKWTIVNKKDTIFKYIFWERLDYLPIPECCFHFIWCQIA